MTKYLVILLLATGSVMLSPVYAQEAPRPRLLVRTWLASQTEHGRDIGRVELQEQAEWVVDGPFGLRRIGWVAAVSGGPDADGWEREPLSIQANGRSVPLHRWRALEQQRHRMMGPEATRAARAVLPIHALVASMRPADEASREVVDGVSCWRIDLVPRLNREPVERYTLWFDRNQGQLIRSRALVRPRRLDQPFTITTDYSRVEGVDVPIERLIEGTTQTKRRLRTYTLLFTYQATYTDYRFERR
jgi:hypothetical protein